MNSARCKINSFLLTGEINSSSTFSTVAKRSLTRTGFVISILSMSGPEYFEIVFDISTRYSPVVFGVIVIIRRAEDTARSVRSFGFTFEVGCSSRWFQITIVFLLK
jgi:hypothetical protein